MNIKALGFPLTGHLYVASWLVGVGWVPGKESAKTTNNPLECMSTLALTRRQVNFRICRCPRFMPLTTCGSGSTVVYNCICMIIPTEQKLYFTKWKSITQENELQTAITQGCANTHCGYHSNKHVAQRTPEAWVCLSDQASIPHNIWYSNNWIANTLFLTGTRTSLCMTAQEGG